MIPECLPQSRFLRHAALRCAHARQTGRGRIPRRARGHAAGPAQRTRPRTRFLSGQAACAQLGLPITQPESIKNNEDFRAQLTALKPDAIIVVGYGRIIPQWMLDLPPLGNINLHASLLPKYRGAAPIQWAIARGETVTGVTTMKIDAGLDTGDILLQQEIPIAPDDTAETLAPKLATWAQISPSRPCADCRAGSIHPRQQDQRPGHARAYSQERRWPHRFLPPRSEILTACAAFNPGPAHIRSFAARICKYGRPLPLDRALPSSELKVEGDRLLVGCGQGTRTRTPRTATGRQETDLCRRLHSRLSSSCPARSSGA